LWIKRKRYYDINPHDRYCYFYTGRRVGETDIEIEEGGFALGFCKCNLTDEKLVHIWEKMREFGPVWMNLQPSMAILLCRVIEKNGLDPIPTLRYVETTGEMLFPHMRKYIQEKMNVVTADQYGCNELNSLAFECPKGHLHCMEENVVIEILDEQGDPLPDGEEGEIVVTSLSNFAMPLIRYKIGDRGCFLKEACFCDDPGKVLKLTTGRSNDWVVDREGNLLNAYIFVRCVENINRIYEHAILQFQVIQHAVDKFTCQ
jgi:phenylacetate-CoA ligase